MTDKYTPPRRGMVDGTVEEAKFSDPIYLTHPNIPKPLHGQNPRTILGQAWWDKRRKIAYAENNYCCWACGISKYNAKYHHWLEGHESYLIDYKRGEARLEKIIALCHSCHNFIHSGRLEMITMKGECSEEKYSDIMNHGYSILRVAGLHTIELDSKIAKWDKWHLVIEGNKYYSKFKDIEDWADYYGN